MRKSRVWQLLAASIVLALTACGSGTTTGGSDEEPLIVAVETSYPPIGFLDPKSNENVGFLVDLLEAMSKDMGREIKFVESEFEQLIPSVRTGRIDVVAGGMTDTAERRELIDFVDYLSTGAQAFTLAKKESAFTSAKDLCGEEVGTPSFTNYVAQLKKLSKKMCPANAPIKVVGTEGAEATTTQLTQGRRDIGVLGAEYVAYLTTELKPDEFVGFGKPLTDEYFGIGFNKDDTEVRDAFAKSLANLIDDGTYAKLLADWGMQDLAIDQVRVNGSLME